MPNPAPADPSIDREPLPAGHPCSWGAITAGTSLAEIPYSIPKAVRTRQQDLD
jgi:hypothetical protein